MSAYTIQRGDTLSALARRFNTTVDALAAANNIQNKDLILTGAKLIVPGKQDDFGKRPESIEEVTGSRPKYDPQKVAEEIEDETTNGAQRRAQTEWKDETGRTFPSRDGVPIYAQGDREWGGERLGNNKKLSRAGCAITACAMAVSKMSGQTVTPGEMDKHLDRNRAYSGDNVHFDKTGSAANVNPPVKSVRRTSMSVSDIDRELSAGRPVVIGVDYHRGGNNVGTDHWMCVTGKNADGTYNVNDPAGGNQIKMRMEGGALRATDGKPYRFTGDAVTFSGGNPTKGPPQREETQGAEPTPRTQGTKNGKSFNLQKELSSADSILSIAIGNAEGNRTVTGAKTASYGSHVDPGNGKKNLGNFSYQAYQNPNVKTPAQADQAQLGVLRSFQPKYEAACRKAGIDPNNPRMQAAFFDLANQCSPKIWGRFLERLPQTMAGKEITVDNLIKARHNALFDDRKVFTATGLKTPTRALADQTRRMRAMEAVLVRNGY
jgi:LysM repeat protein